ncbi:hypothetical protein EMIT0111MI5_30050 [Burkholderia sp. IT-111MI5]
MSRDTPPRLHSSPMRMLPPINVVERHLRLTVAYSQRFRVQLPFHSISKP